MFTRFAGNDVNIRDIKYLERDIRNNDLPSVVFIDPSMHDEPVNDDHPPADMLHGQHLVKHIYDSLRSNTSIWNHLLFAITYDEHGGLFDHVPPGVAEVLQDPAKVRDRESVATAGGSGTNTPNYLPDETINYGVRVPTFLISPYVKKGGVFKQILDHTSILKTILIRFCGDSRPFMSDRVNHAYGLGGALNSEFRNVQENSPSLPTLPDMRTFGQTRTFRPQTKFKIMSKKDLTSKDADFHDYLAFLGRMVKPKE
jgi:phospholipase C